MKIAIITLTLLSAHSFTGAQCNCPSEIDWALAENLSRLFVSQPGSETAEGLLAALSSENTISVPPQPRSLGESLDACRAIIVDSVGEDAPWAMQLGFRFLLFHDQLFQPELSVKISDLATTAPRFFLSQLAQFSEGNPCAFDHIGVVSIFGPIENIEARADPSSEDLAARIEALGSVLDEDFLAVRNRCLELLDEKRRDGTDIPRILRRVEFDPTPFRGRPIRRTFVVVEATVGVDGRVKSVKILRGSDPDVDEAVSAALTQWLFEPKMEDGQPVEFTFVQSYRFHTH